MLYELKPNDNLRPLLKGMTHHLVLESIVAGSTPGAIYVDNTDQPSAALFCYKHRFYLMGKPDTAFASDLQRLFQNEIHPQAIADGRVASVLYFESPIWRDAVENLAVGKRSVIGKRRYFRRKASTNSFHVPENTVVRPIDADLIAQSHLQNIDLLIEEIQSERGSVDDFLKHSFGVCALVGDTIAGLCTSEYNTGARCEVGIMTMEAYQRRGIATAMAHALAAEAVSHGVAEIGWHCWAGNAPSVATALKAEFEPVLNYPAYEIWYSAEAD